MKTKISKAGFRKDFKEVVLEVVRNIPKGKVMSYKQVGIMANVAGASRAVGTVMKNNYDKTVPCHRVVRSDGVVGNYNRGGKEEKIKILKKEGVSFDKNNKVIFDK